ncbi:MAG TPA: zf-HC2 domain-containing protein [Symbiobacteriaceae bacterium]|nr:zf-HC2 domain-containing protein [Symbiobacteriaceae bacterium]
MMKHVQPEQMQRFLADELDLMEREAVTDHLAHCEACADRLVQMTADDDSLSLALGLADDEAAWIASLDLTQPVLAKIRPWYREPAFLAISVPLVAFAAFMLAQVGRLLSLTQDDGGPIGFTVEALRTLIPALWRLNIYLGQGGLLRTLWPVLLLTGAVWFWRSRMKKEENTNA